MKALFYICDFTVGNFNWKSNKIIRKYIEDEDLPLLYSQNCSMIEMLLAGVLTAIIPCMHFMQCFLIF